MSRTSVHGAVICALAWLAVVAGTIAPAAATDVRVTHALFGVHDRTGLSYARVHEGSIRLWGAGVAWNEVETAKGHYDWSKLDTYVSDAQAHHAQVTMVVALTPKFYAADPTKPPRRIVAYQRFVHALMHRYKSFHGHRGIAAYQVWNEGNVSSFWSGTPPQLARLTRALWQVRNQVDRGAKVIAPPMVARLHSQQAGLTRYYQQRVHGRPVWSYVDAAALSLYPLPVVGHRMGVPEDAMAILRQVRARMHDVGMPAHKPIWATEINYGLLSGGGPISHAAPVSALRQRANVARTYLLGAANGLARIFWYRYDMGILRHGGGTIGNSLLADPTDLTMVAPAGKAYALVRSWMRGRLIGAKGARPCARDSHGTYRCVVKDGSTIRRIYWNPFKKAKVTLPAGVRRAQSITGAEHAVEGGARITVNYVPVMVRH